MLAARKYIGPIALSLQGDAGQVFGTVIPPQKLFEIGGSGTLPGYEYKEFAGDQAALVRAQASYAFPFWRMPHRLWRTLSSRESRRELRLDCRRLDFVSTDAALTAVDRWAPGGARRRSLGQLMVSVQRSVPD